MTIPASLCKEYGLTEGDRLSITFVDEEIRLCSWKKNLERAQAIARKYIPEGVSLVDELIAERRVEAAREAQEDAAYSPLPSPDNV